MHHVPICYFDSSYKGICISAWKIKVFHPNQNHFLISAYPINSGSLKKHAHKVTGEVTVLDKKRIKISSMTYDGKS